MKKAEYRESLSCPQRDSVEHEGDEGAQSAGGRDVKEQDGADLLEKILDRDNLNRAYKRVKANKGAPGIDGMTVEDAFPWLREHREELLESIRQGKYKPQPVRRTERTDFPQSGQKCPGRNAEGESLHTRLAGLLRNSKHEDDNAEMG